MKVLSDRLRAISKSMARLTAEQLVILAEIARLDAEGGVSERQTATRVANMTSSTAKQAAGELAMAKQLSTLPAVADAHRNGEISNGQLGAVATIAQAGSEQEALAFAKTATSSQLERQAAASRGRLTEQRMQAKKSRYLAFKPEEDGQSTRLHGRLPFAEARQLESQLRKIADRLGLCEKERPSPSTRMADALMILTKGNASSALHDFENTAKTQSETTNGNGGHSGDQSVDAKPNTESRSASGCEPSVKPKLSVVIGGRGVDPLSSSSGSSGPVIDHDLDPFPERDGEGPSGFGGEEYWEDGPSDVVNEEGNAVVPRFAEIVQRADTRLIIHWNAATGTLNYENGPPIDHPRLQAILCDAQIDIQHCDENGLPTGLVTSAHHATWRQERYLAFRDGVCRMPECEGIGKTHSHHMFEDRADRMTDVRAMMSLCNRDHQDHHDGLFTITGEPEGTIIFTFRDGTVLSSTARPTLNRFRPPKPKPFSKHSIDDTELRDLPQSA